LKKQQRRVFRYPDMVRLISPDSVAIVGVSPNVTGFGGLTLANNGQYDGRLHLVNAKYDRIGERACYPSIKSLPEVPDCVVIAVARDIVEPIIVECAEAGVGGIVLYASGYAETARPEFLKMQDRLTAIAREARMRIAGPNCVGLVNHTRKMVLTFAADYKVSNPGRATVGMVSQSGGVGNGMTQTAHMGTVFSHTLTVGNSCDVDIADYVAYLAHDPTCRAIACVFEGIEDPHRFIEAAELAWEANKPLVVFKMGTGEAGAAAAKSHSGFLAGSFAAYRAAFERTGVVVAENFHSFLETASFFAKAPAPTGRGPAILTTSGGFGVLSADTAEECGVELPQPHGRTLELLKQCVPEYGALRNPCDVTAQSANDPNILLGSTKAMLDDPAYSAVIFLHAYAYGRALDRIYSMRDLAKARGKPLVIAWLSGWLDGPGTLELESDPDVGFFRSIDSCIRVLGAWHRRDAKRKAWENGRDRKAVRLTSDDAKTQAARLIDSAADVTLTEREAKQVLKLYGLPVVGEVLVQSADAAAGAAGKLGYPVAIKVESPDLPHKTEAGVVRLGLGNAAELAEAYSAIMANAAKVPGGRINGVLVQPMISGGVEMLIGARIDPQFGALVMVGFGGILVELLKDTAVALAPVTHAEALGMLDSLKGRRLLTGFRGSEPVDLDKLADIVVRLSEFAADHQDCIAELDVNPLICSGSRLTAVDALIVRATIQPRGQQADDARLD